MIEKIVLKSFKTHKDTVLKFSPGINVITGDSGNGKTNVLLGMNWVIENRPLGSNCIQRGQDKGSVELEVSEGEDVFRVTRSRGGSENSYVLENNGVRLEPFTGFGNSPPAMISEVLNLSDLNVQKQRDPHFLVYTPSGQIATYIRSITKLDEIDRVTKSISGKIRTEKGVVISKQEELKTVNKKLAVLDSINLHLLESKIEETKVHIAEVRRLRAEVEQLNTIVNALRALERRQICIPDNIDQIFGSAEESFESIIKVTTCISNLKPLIVGIKRIEAHEIILPENLEILSTVEGTLDRYNYIDKELETVLDLIDDIGKVDAKIAEDNIRLKQLEFEEIELKEKLENCPSCGSVLTEESKQILLGK